MGKKFKALFAAVLCLLLSLCFFACGKAELSLDRNSATMTVGESITLTAESSKGGAVTWTSDDATVVVVNDGTLVAVGAGQAKVTAEADGVSKTIIVTVRAEKEYVVTVDGVAQTVVKGALAEKPADPVKEADAQYTYTFAGWYVKGTDKAWDFSTPVDQALVIESRFDKTVNKYDVTIAEQTTAYEYGALIEAPATPAKDADAQYSYTFDGWYVVGTDDEWDFATDKVVEAVALEARFVSTVRTYKVTVNGVVSYAKYGDLVAAPAYEPTKASTATTVYTFDKWVVAGTDTAWDFEANTVAGELNIEAKFTEADRVIDVVYVVDGAEYLRAEAKHGDTVAAPAQPEKAATVSTEYVFGGWLVAGTTTAWDFEAEFDAAAVSGEVLTLVAQFTGKTREYTVTLVNGNDTDSVKVAYGNTAKLPTLTKEDEHNVYLFKGWYDEDGNLFNASVTTVTSDITLTAEWTAQPKFYTVSYHDESGALLGEVNVKAGATASADNYVPFKNQTVANVYTFAEWVTADGLAYDFAQGVTADVKLYASYLETVRLYDVTLMDGDEVFATVKVGYNTNFSYDANADIPEYSTAGQYFVAWGEEGAEAGYTGLVLSNMTLYAITAIDTNTYTVTFKVEGCEDVVYNNVYRNDEVAYGSEVIAPTTANTAATKNVLIGWQVEGLDTVYGVDDVIRCPENGITLVAVFEEQFIYYNVSTVLANDAYTLVNENGEALTSADLSDKKWGETIKFKVVKNSVETFGTAVVKVGSSVITATDDVYSLTVISDNMITVEGLGIREYDIAGSVVVEAQQSEVAWAKTITETEQVIVKFTANDQEPEYLSIVDEYGNWEINELLAGNYKVEYVYYNEITGEYMAIANESYDLALNGTLDTDDDGYYLADLAEQSVGMRPGYVTSKNWGIVDGKYTVVTATGTYADNTSIVTPDFIPGNKDFVFTMSVSQDVVRKVQHAEADQEACPGMGLNFESVVDGIPYYANIQVVAEGDIRIYYNYVENGEIKYTEAYTHNLVCSAGGFMGKTGWPDCYRNATITYVRQGNYLHLYLTADGVGTNNRLLPVVIYDLHLATFDLTTGDIFFKEEMTGPSKAPTGTGNYNVLNIPSLAKAFSNVTKTSVSYGTSKFEYLDYYGINYTYNADVVDSYAINAVYGESATYSGTVTVGGDVIANSTLTFVTVENRRATTVATDDSGKFSVNLPLGEYVVTIKNALALTKEIEINHDGESTLDFDLTYGFYGVNYNDGSGTAKTDDTSLIVVHDDPRSEGYDNLAILLQNYNRTIIWSQPIAATSVWGYTLNFPEGMGLYVDRNQGERYNNDIWIKDEIGGKGATFGLNTNSAGQAHSATDITLGVGNLHPEKATWLEQLNIGDIRPLEFMFVREGAKVSRYVRYAGDEAWAYMGYHNTNLSATDDVYFKMLASGRNAKSTLYYTYTDIFYYEGALDTVATVNAVDGKNVIVTVDKTTATVREMVTATAVAEEGYAVNAFIVNGEVHPVTVGQNSYSFASFGFGENYEVTATVVKTNKFKTLSGSVALPRENYAKYWNTNSGTVTATKADGTVYSGAIVDGNYSINLPVGDYEVVVSTNEFKTTFNTSIAGDATKDVVLGTNARGFYKAITNNGLIYSEDGSLYGKLASNTKETGVNGVTFTPSTQIIEFGFRINGNLSGAKYPMYGMFVKEVNANRGGKVATTFGAGDQVGYMTTNDYGDRLTVDDNPWTEWQGGFYPGQEDGSLDAVGTWYKDSYTNIEYKFRIDGYKITMWIKGTNKWWQNGKYNTKNITSWDLCMSEYNIYDRYNAKKADALDRLYRLDQACYFGVSSRQDITEYNSAVANYADFWFEISER